MSTSIELDTAPTKTQHTYLYLQQARTGDTLRALLPLLFDDPEQADYRADPAGNPRLVCGYDATTRTLAVIGDADAAVEDLLEEATAPRSCRVERLRLVTAAEQPKAWHLAEVDAEAGTTLYAAAFFPTAHASEHGRFYPQDQQLFSQANRLDALLDLTVTIAAGGDCTGFVEARSDADWGYYWRTLTALRLVTGPKTALEPTAAALRIAAMATEVDRKRAMAAHVARSHAFQVWRTGGQDAVVELLTEAERRVGHHVALKPGTLKRRLSTAAAWDKRCQAWVCGLPEPVIPDRDVVNLGLTWSAALPEQRQVLKDAWLDQVAAVDHRSFEFLACEVWTRAGMADPVVTKQSGDKGIDFEGVVETGDGPRRLVAQAKHRCDGKAGSSVGDDRVRALRGALRQYANDAGVLITNGTFSKAAYEEAAGNYPIELVDGDRLAELAITLGLGVEHLGGGKYAVGQLTDHFTVTD